MSALAVDVKGDSPPLLYSRSDPDAAAQQRAEAFLDLYASAYRSFYEKSLEPLTVLQLRKVWEASKEIGPALKPGPVELRDLRNRVAREVAFTASDVVERGRSPRFPRAAPVA